QLAIRRVMLDVVPFVTEEEFSLVWAPGAKHSGWAEVARFFDQFLVEGGGGPSTTATAAPQPSDCTTTWRRALRQELDDPLQWRRPAVATSETRLALWGSGA